MNVVKVHTTEQKVLSENSNEVMLFFFCESINLSNYTDPLVTLLPSVLPQTLLVITAKL